MVVRGEGTAEHLIVVGLDLCEFLSRGAFKHLGNTGMMMTTVRLHIEQNWITQEEHYFLSNTPNFSLYH